MSDEDEVTRLRRHNRRLLVATAAALERTQVADDPSGAADEATAILEQVVTLAGEYVEPSVTVRWEGSDAGPNDPLPLIAKAAVEEARVWLNSPPTVVARTLVESLKHEPWNEPDAAEGWQLLGAMCLAQSAKAAIGA